MTTTKRRALDVSTSLTSTQRDPKQRSTARAMLNKVPEVTLLFWVIKIMATTVGETAADFLAVNLNFGLTTTTFLMSAMLIGALVVQFRARKYIPAFYWVSVVLISVVGTLITDNLVDNFGISLWTTTIGFTAAMLATFAAWFGVEKTLSVHSIDTTKREAFYWGAILFTFALGTAAGDLIAETLNLGYWKSALLFFALIGAVTIARFQFKMNATLAFWMAYVLTRPLGASIGDYLSQPHKEGGLGLGTTGTSAIFLLSILAIVTYFHSQHRKLEASN